LNGIAGTLKALGCHCGSMPSVGLVREWAGFQTVPLVRQEAGEIQPVNVRPRKRAARMGRNPATGEAIQIKASKKVAFRAAKDLKMAI
jgi:hypothetical protein